MQNDGTGFRSAITTGIDEYLERYMFLTVAPSANMDSIETGKGLYKIGRSA